MRYLAERLTLCPLQHMISYAMQVNFDALQMAPLFALQNASSFMWFKSAVVVVLCCKCCQHDDQYT